jgi:DNA-directed RNA polymerase specialized sigma subunit
MSQLKDTINRLKNLDAERDALLNIPRRIKNLELEYDGLKATQTDASPVAGGENKQEEVRLNNILKRQNLERDYTRTKEEVEQMEEALAKLTFAERRVLELFFINRPKEYIEILSEELRCERPTVYRLKDKALLELTRRLCGQVNL